MNPVQQLEHPGAAPPLPQGAAKVDGLGQHKSALVRTIDDGSVEVVPPAFRAPRGFHTEVSPKHCHPIFGVSLSEANGPFGRKLA